MRIIDSHVHVWKTDPKFPWAIETTNPPNYDATPEMLLELMAANGVEKTVLVQVIYYRWDNSYTTDAMKRFPDKFFGVCRINPQDPKSPDHLSRWVEDHGFRGVRLSPSTDASGDWFKSSLMDPIFCRAAQLKIPVLILTGPSRLIDLAAILKRHPDVDIVVDHMADCPLDQPENLKLLLNLAKFERVYVKVSHTWSLSKQAYPWKDTFDMVKMVYESFGGKRLMWGTDWPVCLNKARYEQTLSLVRDEMNFFSPEDKDWILGKTALKLWEK